MEKERLDVLLVQRNLIDTREKAKRLIMAGQVFSNNERMDKPGVKVAVDIPLKVKGGIPYVSRGGFKLEKALNTFNVNIKDKIIVDVGASTGGFTDCALQNGAKQVYAVDVGYNQLVWKLRSDPRVIVMERMNFRYATKDLFNDGEPDFSMIDVSFISLKLILPVLKNILKEDSDVVALIKPQFEAEKHQVGKKGIIRDKSIHKEVLLKVISFAKEEGYSILNITFSPITGGEGNIEFLVHFGWKKEIHDVESLSEDDISEVVNEAHTILKKEK